MSDHRYALLRARWPGHVTDLRRHPRQAVQQHEEGREIAEVGDHAEQVTTLRHGAQHLVARRERPGRCHRHAAPSESRAGNKSSI